MGHDSCPPSGCLIIAARKAESGRKRFTRLDALDGFVGVHPLGLAVQHLGHLRRVREKGLGPVTAGHRVPDFRRAPGDGRGHPDPAHSRRHDENWEH